MTNASKDKIVDILCRRDGCTRKEAEELVQVTVEEIEACMDDYDEVIDIMMNNLGLEGDFILDLLY